MRLHLMIISVALLSTMSCNNYNKKENAVKADTIKQLQLKYGKEDSARNVVMQEYDEALSKLDSLVGVNIKFIDDLNKQTTGIDSLKNEVKREIRKKDVDFEKANAMVLELNNKIDGLIARFRQNEKK